MECDDNKNMIQVPFTLKFTVSLILCQISNKQNVDAATHRLNIYNFIRIWPTHLNARIHAQLADNCETWW